MGTHQGSSICTQRDNHPWWKVTLPVGASVAKVAIIYEDPRKLTGVSVYIDATECASNIQVSGAVGVRETLTVQLSEPCKTIVANGFTELKIMLMRTYYLQFSEVEAFGTKSAAPMERIPLTGQQASMSSVHVGPALLAIDGNPTHQGSSICTRRGNHPWWKVTLPAGASVAKVAIIYEDYRKLTGVSVYIDATECASNVQVSGAVGVRATLTVQLSEPCKRIIANGSTELKIMLMRTYYLQFSEVEAFGTKSAATSTPTTL